MGRDMEMSGDIFTVETGYKSIFISEPELAGKGGSLKYVTSFIDAEAKSEKWKNCLENSRQFNLF